MTTPVDQETLERDPCKILGVREDAGAEDIRRAYLEKIKMYPPDRAPEAFEKIRDAYELLQDPRKRMRLMLSNVDPKAPLVSLLEGQKGKRNFVGPEPWLEVMR
jgi:preprotein translocase subunit Sec63